MATTEPLPPVIVSFPIQVLFLHMLKHCVFFVKVAAKHSQMSEHQFRAYLAPCMKYLYALEGSFYHKSGFSMYYPPHSNNNETDCWLARAWVKISVGESRTESIIELYKAIGQLLVYELPESTFDVDIWISGDASPF